MARKKKQSRWTPVINAFRLVGGLILFIFWLAIAWGGIEGITTDRTRFPGWFGWIMVVVAGWLMYATMARWIKYVGGWLLGGALMGVLRACGAGQPAPPNSTDTPYWYAIFIIAMLLPSAFLAGTIAVRKLTREDRILLMCLYPAFLSVHWSMVVFPIALFTLLAAAWLLDRVRKDRRISKGGLGLTARSLSE